MRVPVLTQKARFLARSAAVVAISAAAAGCSSNAMRFTDDMFTSSAPRSSAVQTPQYAQDTYPDNVDRTYTGSINRQAVQPVGVLSRMQQRRAGHPVPSADVGLQPAAARPAPQVAVAPAYQPFPTVQPSGGAVVRQQMPAPSAAPARGVDQTVTGSIQPRPAAAQPVQDTADGWSRAGGTQVTVREGETVYNLSRRFGVPVDAILRANGLNDAKSLAVGQNVVIPTYVYSRKAPNSMPDSDPKVAAASSSRGMKVDQPAQKTPAPADGPGERLAVLPQGARPAERAAAGQQPAAAPATSAPTAGSVYTVQQGDTLSSIAKRLGSTTTAIKQANKLDSGLIRVGQKLTIPGATAETVAATRTPKNVDPIVTGSTPPAARTTDGSKVTGYTPPAKAGNVAEASVQEAAAPEATGIGRMRWPVRGRIIAGFGGQSGGKKSDGIDIAVPEGTPVKAAENGVVIYAGDGLKDFGNTVLVRHENGLVTVYGHASKITVARGDTVRRGQEIARSGLSGNADAPKLHFEVRRNSTPVDPVKFLE